jgi:hypothetical protein
VSDWEQYRSKPKPDAGSEWEKYRSLPAQPMPRGKVASDMLNQAGVGKALEAGGQLALNVADEMKDPMFHLRAFPPTAAAAELAGAVKSPEEEAARLRSSAAGVTLGGSAKLEGLAREKLGGDPQGMAAAESATAKATEKYPVENIASNAVLPAGPELKGFGAVEKAVGRGLTQGAYGGVSAALHGRDPVEGVAHGMMGAGAGEVMSKAEGPLYNAAGKSFVRAVGPRAGILDRLDREGVRVENISQLGHDFRKEGLVPLFGSKEAAAKVSGERLKELGPQYQALDQHFSDAVHASRPPPLPAGGTVGARPANASAGPTALMPGASTFSFRRAAAAAKPNGLNPEAASAAGSANRFSERLAQGQGGLGDAREQIANAAENADYRFRPPLGARLHREAIGRARENVLDQVEEVLGPEQRAALEVLNRRYAIAKTANKLSTPAASREVLHQHASPLEMLEAAKLGGAKAALLEPIAAEAVRRSNALVGHGLYAGSLGASAAPALVPAAQRTAADEEERPWLDYFNPRRQK